MTPKSVKSASADKLCVHNTQHRPSKNEAAHLMEAAQAHVVQRLAVGQLAVGLSLVAQPALPESSWETVAQIVAQPLEVHRKPWVESLQTQQCPVSSHPCQLSNSPCGGLRESNPRFAPLQNRFAPLSKVDGKGRKRSQ